MRSILYVSDGERDRRMLPPIVRKVIGEHDLVDFRAWHDIQLQGSFGRAKTTGYGRKLSFMIAAAARDDHSLIATVDRDRAGSERLRELKQARGDIPPVAVAVGEAIPHGEAWLVDDLVPLRTHLGLDPHAPRPDLKDPKASLHALIREADRSDVLEIIESIAEDLAIERCQMARETGLAAFVDDLKDQFREG